MGYGTEPPKVNVKYTCVQLWLHVYCKRLVSTNLLVVVRASAVVMLLDGYIEQSDVVSVPFFCLRFIHSSKIDIDIIY